MRRPSPLPFLLAALLLAAAGCSKQGADAAVLTARPDFSAAFTTTLLAGS